MQRIEALDGLRGLLALIVVLFHVDVAFGGTALNPIGTTAVLIFFALSGYVLARAYDGRPFAFMARRVVRLWPVFALCIVLGNAMGGRRPPLNELIWLPPMTLSDPPAWSLYWEAWATPFFPLAFRAARRRRTAFMVITILSFALIRLDPQLGCVFFFLSGISAAQFAIPWPKGVSTWVRWLGKVSYSLYLTHALVMRAAFDWGGAWAVLAGLPLVFLVAWIMWRYVELPSIRLSRRIGRIWLAVSCKRTAPPLAHANRFSEIKM